MQRYRINYRLFFGLVVGSAFSAGLLFWVWTVQVDKNATWFLEKSEAATEAGELRDAFNDLKLYVQLRKDDIDARVQLANLALDIIKLEDVKREEYSYAYGITEETVRLAPGNQELRRRLVDILLLFGRPHDAINNIDTLLEKNPGDAELLALRLRALFAAKDYSKGIAFGYKLIGYDKTSHEFDVTKATAADQPLVYYQVASVLFSRNDEKKLATRVIDQMVETNPDSVVAHQSRARFMTLAGDEEGIRESIDRAFELDPNDPETLILSGAFALMSKDYETARKMLGEGIRQYPDKKGFYEQLARAELASKQYEAALKVLNQGIERFPGPEGFFLRMAKIDVLFSQQNIAGVEPELKALKELKSSKMNANIDFQAVIDFQRARIKYTQKQWHEAAQEFSRVAPLLHGTTTTQIRASAGTLRAKCYEQLGKLDLAVSALNQVTDAYPKYTPALLAKQQIMRRINRDRGQGASTNQLDTLVARELEKPKSLQRWKQIGKAVDQMVESSGISESRDKLIRAKIFTRREMFAEAANAAEEACRLDPEDQYVRLSAIGLMQRNPDGGPKQALEMLSQAVEDFGDSVRLRILHGSLLMAMSKESGTEDLPEQLNSLTEGIEDWPAEEQAQLWSAVGVHFQQLNMPEEVQRCLVKAVELVPTNLPARMYLFRMALQQKDDEAMRAAQKGILEIVKSKDDSNYVLTEVKRRILAFGQNKIPRHELEEARDMLAKAMVERPNWHELYFTDGHLALILDEDGEHALKQFDKALSLGPANLNAAILQARLLSERGRYREAKGKMELIPKASRGDLLGRLEAVILLNTDEEEAGFEAAERQAARQENNAATQIWFANIARQLGENEKAEKAFLKAVELNPSEQQYWMQLIVFYLELKKSEEVENAFREAQLHLLAENLPLLTGKYYELQSRWVEAEDIYLTAYSKRLDQTAVARRMAGFYLSWSRQDLSKRDKAAPFINRILRAANEGTVPADSGDVVWARQLAARLLATSGDYQKSLKAIQLLSTEAVDGPARDSDELLKAQILATRKDPASMLKAIELLSRIQREHGLALNSSLNLARLLNAVGMDDQCESQLLATVRHYGSNPQVWATYVLILIDQGDLQRAEQRLNRLVEMVPDDPGTVQLRARLAAKQGRHGEAHRQIRSLLPENLRLVDDKQLEEVRRIAQFAAEIGDLPLAEQLFSLYVKRHPERAMLTAQYLARYGDPDKAIELLKQLFDTQKETALELTVRMLQSRRAEFGDRYDEATSELVSRALREDPDSVRRRLLQAQLLELRGHYEESARAYEELLGIADAPRSLRAMVMNNLSFLWALMGERVDEASQYIKEAESILGPISDILDTKAIVAIAHKDYDAAITNMRLSLEVEPTAIKYFHLAQAQLLGGNGEEAIIAWDKGVEAGLAPEVVTKLEIGVYRQIAEQIESLRTKSAEL